MAKNNNTLYQKTKTTDPESATRQLTRKKNWNIKFFICCNSIFLFAAMSMFFMIFYVFIDYKFDYKFDGFKNFSKELIANTSSNVVNAVGGFFVDNFLEKNTMNITNNTIKP